MIVIELVNGYIRLARMGIHNTAFIPMGYFDCVFDLNAKETAAGLLFDYGLVQ